MKMRNKAIAVLTILIISSVLAFAFYKKGQNNTGNNPQKPFYLYQLNPSVAVPTNRLPELARKFAGNNFTSLKQNQILGGIRYSSNDPSEFYEVNESEGRFSFSKNLSRYMGNYIPKLPDPKNAQDIARKFLSENKLMAENPAEMHLIHSGGLRADDGEGKVTDKMITLTYGRVVDGVPVIGKSSKIVVNVGDQGLIEGVIRNWKAVTSKKELSANDVKKQEEMQRELLIQVTSEFGKGAKANIRRSYMVYFDNGGRFLQPVMAFETIVTLAENGSVGKEIPYLGVIEAMRNPAEKLNLTGNDPIGIRTINANKSNPDRKPQPLDKGD